MARGSDEAQLFKKLGEMAGELAEILRDQGLLGVTHVALGDQGSGVRGQGAGIRDQGSGGRDQGAGIKGQGSGARGQGAGRPSSDPRQPVPVEAPSASPRDRGLPPRSPSAIPGRKTPFAPSTAHPRRPADSGDRLNPALAPTREEALGCTRCPLHRTRTQVVFGSGSEYAALVFIGEAPGADEDLQGKPFVGRAGQLLTRLLKEIGIPREEVYITNVVKCRPPNNRNPQPDEIAACEPYLSRQMEVIQPKLICTLGSFAAQTLLKTQQPISRLRGRLHLYGDQNRHGRAELAAPEQENGLQRDTAIFTVKVLPMYHPAFILRYPTQLKVIQEDFQLLKREYEKVMEEKA